MAETGVKVHQTTILRALPTVGLYEREARKKTILEENPTSNYVWSDSG